MIVFLVPQEVVAASRVSLKSRQTQQL